MYEPLTTGQEMHIFETLDSDNWAPIEIAKYVKKISSEAHKQDVPVISLFNARNPGK